MKPHLPPAPDIERDPFHELGVRAFRWRVRVLGARFEFSSNSRELLDLAREAFAGLPQHRWPGNAGRMLHVSLKHVRALAPSSGVMPPRPLLSSGAGLLCGHIDARNFVIVDPAAARALVQVDDSLRRNRRLLRHELVEFAAITLATREQNLVSLHAGCVGAHGKGLLLLGSSGSGKSTLALHAALGGLDFLAEDSVFVQSATLRASGLSAYVHARVEALPLIGDRRARLTAGRAPLIQRRSGVRKREIDLREARVRLASRPLRIVATVVLSARRARGALRLEPLTVAELKRILRKEQPFAVDRPGWREFERRVLRAGGFRLERGACADAVANLRRLLQADRA